MYWIIIYFLVAIVLVVYMTYTERAEKESHDWNTEDHLVDEELKSKMQELACCHTTSIGMKNMEPPPQSYAKAS